MSDEVAASLPLEVTLSSGAGDCDVEVAPAGDGRLRCTYTAQRAGFYRLEVTCEGTQLSGSPFSVRVRSNGTPQQVSPRRSPHSGVGDSWLCSRTSLHTT